LKKIFKLYIFNNLFILDLLNYYKNNKTLSDNQLNNKIKEEKSKIEFNKSLYKIAIDFDNEEALQLLFKHDNRSKNIILKELFEIFEKNERIYQDDEKKKYYINKLQHQELSIEVSPFYLFNLENINKIRKTIIKK